MKKSKLLLMVLMILPWFSLPILGKDAFKRFLPACLFISFVVRIESYVAEKRKWWWFYEKLHPKLKGETPLIWGPFLIGSMLILKLTYGNFFIYMITNLVIDSIFTYPFVSLLKRLGIASLVRLNKVQLSMLFFLKSLLLYGFQFFKEKVQG